MKRFRKLAGCIALASCVLAFTGCGEKKKEVITLQVYDQLANYSGEQVGWFAKVMLDKFNVKLNIIPETGNTYTTRMENGNLGDIVIWGADSGDYLKAVEQGLLFDWEEDGLLSDFGPYIQEHMAKALEKNRTISGTGKLYGFGHGVSTSSSDRQSFMYTWDMRFDLYDQLGRPEIKNYDDLLEVFKKMKEICPKDDFNQETYAVSIFPDWDGNMVMYAKSLATAYVGWDEFGFGFYDPESGTYKSCLEADGPYIEALRFLNKLKQNNLLDPDSQTQQYDAFLENYKNGTAFWNIFNWMGSQTYNSDEHVAAGKGMYPVRPTEASPICYGQSVYGGNRVWSIGAKTKYPELCMQILNYLATPEGFMTTLYGPKGVTWDYDANGKTYFTELGKQTNTNNDTPMPEPYKGTFKDGLFQMNNTTWAEDATNPDSNGETYNDQMWESNIVPARNELEQKWRDWAGAESVEEYLGNGKYVFAPGSFYSDAAMSDELHAKVGQIATSIKNGSWKAIYAATDSEFNTIIAQMTKEAREYGIEEVNDFYEGEAARRKAAEALVK